MKKFNLKFFLLPVFFFAAISCNNAQTNDATTNNTDTFVSVVENKEVTTVETVTADTIVIVGVGDIMLGTSYPDASTLPPNNDCSFEMANVKSYLQNADVSFCNLEGVMTTGGVAKTCNDPSVCYVFRMPETFASCLVDAGFDLVSLANNHVNDFGADGRENTRKAIEAVGLTHAGLEDTPSAIFEKDGIKYGFAAFAPHTGTARFNNYTYVVEVVKKLEEECDIVIVSFHSGAEGSGCQHVTRADEIFLGANRGNVYKFAHLAIDAGADVVFGHGPHVTRAVELYKDRFIAYSMGNFCTYSRINIQGVSGLAPIFRVQTDKEGAFLKAEIIPTYQQRFKGTFVDPQKRVIKVIQDLTKADFPETKLHISDDGIITPTE